MDFELVYFPCTDKKVMSEETRMCHGYRERADAQARIPNYQRTEHYYYEDQTKPVPKDSVEAFYLVPDSLYDQLLKPYPQYKFRPLYFHVANQSLMSTSGGTRCAGYRELQDAAGWPGLGIPTVIQKFYLVTALLYEEILQPYLHILK